jgi:hypothetical protein
MRTIKVQCGCGQRYAFDVEPVEGRMPYAVNCPLCGADGTEAANELLAESPAYEPARAASVASPGVRLRESAGAPALHLAAAPAMQTAVAHAHAQPAAAGRSPGRLLPGQLDRPRAESEARAKIFWGDPPDEVIKFLMRQNISGAEASELVRGMFDERAAAVRSNGIRKIVTGSGMVCVPIIAWFVFSGIGVIPLKLFAVTVMVGLWGAWRVLKGTLMILSPRSESGDVADQ